MKATVEEGECNGRAMLAIKKDPPEQWGHPFSFSAPKAKLLLAALKQEPDFLEKFIAKNQGGRA